MKQTKNRNTGKSQNKPKTRENRKSSGFNKNRTEQRPAKSSNSGNSRRDKHIAGIKFPIYGPHATREAWLNPSRQIHDLYITQSALDGFQSTIKEAKAKNLTRPDPKIIDKDALDKMLHQGAVHQGIAISTAALAELSAEDLTREAASAKSEKPSVILVLDQVTDPHNVGAILRSASAFGASGIVMQRKHAPELSGVLAKIATGAIDHIPVAQETNLSRALEDLKDAGYFIIGLDEHDTNTIHNVLSGANKNAPHDKITLVLGSEGDGIRRLVRENCDVIACLPTQGAIQSLNVSNAAAVALFTVLNS